MASSNDNVSMALFCDFENVALGVRDANYDKFDIKPVLERLLLKGSIVVKKAYCDWDRYKAFKAPMHEANFELIEIPHVRQSGKNSADIRMVVDALDLCYTKSHVDTFVIISGDSDFSPLVSKLRENAKKVIGVGVKQSTSDLLVANCDEFIFYDDLVRESRRAKRDSAEAKPAVKRTPEEERARREEMDKRRNQAVEIAVNTFEALVSERGDSGKIWASVLKEAIKRRKPDFSESYYGFRTFGNLIEEAKARGLLEFGRDEKSGAYVYRSSGAVASDAAGVESVAASVVSDVSPDAKPEGQSRGGRNRNRGGRSAAERFAERQAERAAAAHAAAPVVTDSEAVAEDDDELPAGLLEAVERDAAEARAQIDAERGRGRNRGNRGGRNQSGRAAAPQQGQAQDDDEELDEPVPMLEPVAAAPRVYDIEDDEEFTAAAEAAAAETEAAQLAAAGAAHAAQDVAEAAPKKSRNSKAPARKVKAAAKAKAVVPAAVDVSKDDAVTPTPLVASAQEAPAAVAAKPSRPARGGKGGKGGKAAAVAEAAEASANAVSAEVAEVADRAAPEAPAGAPRKPAPRQRRPAKAKAAD
ncbi:MAG: NYN domain-containing protein [Sphingomonadaceae bacterium]